jgi:hypothetical protein
MELDPETGLFYELTFGQVWHELCLVLGVTEEEECTQAEGAELEALNVTGGVEFVGEDSPKGSCAGEAESYEEGPEAGDLLSLTEGGTLAVSE